MEFSGKVLRSAWEKTVREDRRKEVEEVKEIKGSRGTDKAARFVAAAPRGEMPQFRDGAIGRAKMLA